MKKITTSLVLVLLTVFCCYSSTKKDTTKTNKDIINRNETRIFNGNVSVMECNATGEVDTSRPPVTGFKGMLFTIDGRKGSNYIIKFFRFNDSTDRKKYNYKDTKTYFIANNGKAYTMKDSLKTKTIPMENLRYFLLSNEELESSTSVYSRPSSVAFGTLINPIKFRPSKSEWSSNISLGASIQKKWNVSLNQSLGVILGFSVGSVRLDKNSTNEKTTDVTDRPAYTPSIHGVYAYKNINLLIGLGFDFINRSTELEQSWIYYRKPWLGLGIGFNLFTEQNSNATEKSKGQ